MPTVGFFLSQNAGGVRVKQIYSIPYANLTKRHGTPLVIVKEQSSCTHYVSQQYTWNNNVKILTQLVAKLREYWKKRAPFSHKLCALRCLNSRPQPWSRTHFKYFCEKLLLKNFVTSEGVVFHNVTVNSCGSSPLLVTKKVFMLTITLSNTNIVQCR